MKRFNHIVVVVAVGGLVAAIGTTRIAGGKADPLLYDASVFHTGDLLFVKGTSWQSRIVLWGQQHSELSHVGLVWVREKGVFIVHATPHSSGMREAGGVIIEPLHRFLSPERVTQAALYRVKHVSKHITMRAAKVAARYAATNTPFDYGFDLSSDDKLYCTELIWTAYRIAGAKLFGKPLQEPDGILMPSELSHSPQLAKISEFR